MIFIPGDDMPEVKKQKKRKAFKMKKKVGSYPHFPKCNVLY
jgi:hypothetical protein